MKRTAIFLSLFLLGGTVFSQSRALENFLEPVAGKRDVTHVSLSGGVFRLASWVAELSDEQDEDLEAIANMADGIESMEIYSIEDFDTFFDKDDVEDLIRDMQKEGFEILMTIREDRQLIRILSESDNVNALENVTMISVDGWDLAIITMKGSIRLKDLSEAIDN